MQTWPLVTAPGRWSRNDTADTVHHEWILAWDAHQLAHDPRHLFDANIFYPEPDTLAYSDHLIVQGALARAAVLAGRVAGSRLQPAADRRPRFDRLDDQPGDDAMDRQPNGRDLQRLLMAFNAMTLTRFAEIQDQHFEFFPLALFALDRLLTTPRVRDALQLAGWFVLQALTCGYLLAFMSAVAGGGGGGAAGRMAGARISARRAAPAVSAAVAAVLLRPFLLPYLRVTRQQGFTRPLAEVALYSARFADYLSTGGRLHYNLWSYRFFDREALFPGHRVSLCDRGDGQRRGLA